MSTLFKVSAMLVAASLLGACAQQEEPEPAPVVIVEEPTYSKF